VFPVAGTSLQTATMDDINGLRVDQISLADRYSVAGNGTPGAVSLTLTGAATSIVNSGAGTIFGDDLGIVLNGTDTVQANNDLEIDSALSGVGGITKTGSARLTLGGTTANSYA